MYCNVIIIQWLHFSGLLDDMQETTLFARDEKGEQHDGKGEENKNKGQRNGGAILNKQFPVKGSTHSPASTNGHTNTVYKDDLSSDDDGNT